MANRVIFTTCTCDNEYIDVLKAFLMSMRLNNGVEEVIKAELVNCTYEQFVDLRKIYGNIKRIPVDLPGADWTKPENMVRVMRIRIPRVLELLNEGWDQVLFLDCDAIIRKPIDGIWEGVEPGVLKIWHRPNKTVEYRFQGGVVAYGNSQEVRDYYQDFLKSLDKDWSFFQGQKNMYTVWKRHRDSIKLVSLDPTYNDSLFKKQSHIWHSKLGHFKEKRFQAEYKRYLAMAQEI